MRVVVTGTLRQRTFDDADGRAVTVTDVDAAEIAASLKWATVRITKATARQAVA